MNRCRNKFIKWKIQINKRKSLNISAKNLVWAHKVMGQQILQGEYLQEYSE